MTYLTPERLRAAMQPAAQDVESAPFGGVVRLAEPTRAAHKAAGKTAEFTRDGATFYDLDVFHAALFAACVVDPNTGAPIFADAADVLATVGYGDWRWQEVARLAERALEMGKTTPAHLKSGLPGADH